MAKPQISAKRLAIDKASTQMVVTTAIAAFVTVFALVAAHALWSQGLYQHRVINARRKADSQLKTNLQTVTQLQSAYEAFVAAPQNVIGGDPAGKGPTDGDNAKIVLDALPSQYDFPALTASVEKILTNRGLNIDSIGGTDDQVAQQNNASSSNPTSVTMPFTFSVSRSNYATLQKLVEDLQNSIRPFALDTIEITGGGNSMQLTATAHTFYQPAKNLQLRTEVVK